MHDSEPEPVQDFWIKERQISFFDAQKRMNQVEAESQEPGSTRLAQFYNKRLGTELPEPRSLREIVNFGE